MTKKKQTTKQNNDFKTLQKLIGISMSFFIVLVIITASAVAYQYIHREVIYPGVYINNTAVGGQTPHAVATDLHTKFETFKQQGITYQYQTSSVEIIPTILSPNDPDLTQEILFLNPEKTSKQAFQYGRDNNWFINLFTPLWYRFQPITVDPTVQLDEQKLTEILKTNFKNVEQEKQEPKVTWSLGTPTIIPGKNGFALDYQAAVAQTKKQAQRFDTSDITLVGTTTTPAVTVSQINGQMNDTLTTLGTTRPSLLWEYENNSWYIPFSEYQTHIELTHTDGRLGLQLDSNWLQERLEVIAQTINQPSKDARFTVENGRVLGFQESTDGLLVNNNATIEKIQENFRNQSYQTNIITKIDRAKIQTHEVNDLGIEEIIGVGTSNFAGSPANRRHNIQVGADALNGLLIKPGEEFSLVKNLVPIDGENGYLPELVIKGDKTIPEYGGGLCQIGTTTFRAALASGLDITERQNHSYRVSYYEPAGTDATIYDPAPDFKFINDTENHVLIQTRIEGDELIFEFWGTSDGRTATTSKPRIYNITSPPPTKYIETTDLEPGKIKCTERAHNGATAELDYSVTYADGEIHEETFTSYYRPWQEVCLKGVDPNASSTEITNVEE